MQSVLIVLSICVAMAYGQDALCLANGNAANADCLLEFASAAADKAAFCASDCYNTLNDLYISCGYTGALNIIATFCAADTPDVPDFPVPTAEQQLCLGQEALTNSDLIMCITSLAANPAGLCTSSCLGTIKSAYSSCGISTAVFDQVCGGGGGNGAVHPVAVTMMVLVAVIAALFV